MNAPRVAWTVALRTWRKTFRRPVVLTFSFFQPLMWMLFFGFLFQRYPLELYSAGISYLSFLAPGVAAMTVLFGASQAGISLVRDHQTGVLQRMLATPAGAGAQLAGRLGADVVRLLLQAAAVLALGIAVGARFEPQARAVAAAAGALALFAAAVAAVSAAVALVVRAPEPMATFVQVINMPVLFTSTALVPARQMPEWLQGVVAWNPLTLAVDGLRDALLFGISMRSVKLSALLLLAATLFLLAALLLRRAERSPS
jgi:ABC-2 type transport system permease protein